MADEIKGYERQYAQSPMQVAPPSGYGELGRAQAASAKVFEKAFKDMALQKAVETGTLEALEGKTEGKSLPPAFGATQSAYNDAVSNIEARRAVIDYSKRAHQEFLNASNPAKFNAGSPQGFMRRLKDAQATYEANLRPEARAKAGLFMEQVNADLETKMLGRAIGHQNAVTKQKYADDVADLKKELRTAIVSGDDANAVLLKQQLDKTIGDYSKVNGDIARRAPREKKKIEEEMRVSGAIGDYLEASREGTEADYMKQYFQNGPDKDVGFDEWQHTMSQMLQTASFENRMTGEAQQQTMMSIEQSIKDMFTPGGGGQIVSRQDIIDIPPEELSTTNKMKMLSFYDNQMSKQNKAIIEKLGDMRQFAEGRGAAVPKARVDDYFQNAVDGMQNAQEGRPVSLLQMANSILGQSAFPTTGMQGVPTNTNVKKFDSIMKAQLMNRDNPAAVAEAAAVWKYVTQTNESPGLVKLDGDSLAIAALTSELSLGSTMTPEQAAQAALTQVLDKDEPKIKAARQRYDSQVKKNVPSYFKEVFGTSPAAFTDDAALATFEDVFRNTYMQSNSESAALVAAKTAMASWGTSEFGPDDMVMNHPVEKEYLIAQIGNSATNQLAIKMQEIMNRNPDLGIKWLNNYKIDIRNLTDEDKVFGRLALQGGLLSNKGVEVVVNGHRSNVYTITDTTSGLATEGKYRYYLFYRDKLGNLQPILDEGSPFGTATWTPQELSEYAPEIAKERDSERMQKIYKQIRKNQIEGMLEAKKDELNWAQRLGSFMLTGAIMGGMEKVDGYDIESLEKQFEEGKKGKDK